MEEEKKLAADRKVQEDIIKKQMEGAIVYTNIFSEWCSVYGMLQDSI